MLAEQAIKKAIDDLKQKQTEENAKESINSNWFIDIIIMSKQRLYWYFNWELRIFIVTIVQLYYLAATIN